MIQKPFDQIDKTDVDKLIADGIGESRTLEYKRELPGPKSEDRKEFLRDISSFANAAGGYIFYGIQEKVGPDKKKTGEYEVAPLKGTTIDEAKQRLENMIRTWIVPRVRVQIEGIKGWGDGEDFIMLIHVPKSFASPHMETESGRFYSRNSTGKYPLDVTEIRSAVLATESQADRIRRFREERIGRIVAEEASIVIRPPSPGLLVLHMVPITSFLNRERLDLTDEKKVRMFPPIRIVGWGGGNHRYNLDGYLTWGAANDRYCQLFFDGAVEAVFAGLCRTDYQGKSISTDVVAFSADVVAAAQSYLKGYIELGLTGPVALSMAILGCRDSYISSVHVHRSDGHPVDRDVVILPDVVGESLEETVKDVHKFMKPLFDSVWNIYGFPRSEDYDENGNWAPKKWT